MPNVIEVEYAHNVSIILKTLMRNLYVMDIWIRSDLIVSRKLKNNFWQNTLICIKEY